MPAPLPHFTNEILELLAKLEQLQLKEGKKFLDEFQAALPETEELAFPENLDAVAEEIIDNHRTIVLKHLLHRLSIFQLLGHHLPRVNLLPPRQQLQLAKAILVQQYEHGKMAFHQLDNLLEEELPPAD